MVKKKILIAAVLKPTDDIRHFEKLAVSLAKTNKYAINIIGKGEKKRSGYECIHFIPTGRFSRWSIRRVLISLKFLAHGLAHKPHLVIITTPELIIAGAVLKRLTPCKLVYDIQENYRLNLLYQEEYRTRMKPVFLWVQKHLENLAGRVTDHFILAEACYADELDFIGQRFTILENKALRNPAVNRRQNPTNNGRFSLLFSGTVSHYSGIQTALDIYRSLKQIRPSTQLMIVGSCHQPRLLKELKTMAKYDPDLHLNISSHPISHQQILEAISQADLGLITYQPTPVNQNRMPTRLFEYAAYGLPFIVRRNTLWHRRAEAMGQAIPVDFADPDPTTILSQWQKIKAQDPEKPLENPFWINEELVLHDLINQLISTPLNN